MAFTSPADSLVCEKVIWRNMVIKSHCVINSALQHAVYRGGLKNYQYDGQIFEHIVSDTSNIPQADIGSYLGPHSSGKAW